MTIRREDLDAGRVDLSDAVEPGVPPLPPLAPGEVLREEFLKPLGLTPHRLALEMGVPPNRVAGIVNGTRAVTAETAILLGRRLNTSPRFWLGLQMARDLEEARRALA